MASPRGKRRIEMRWRLRQSGRWPVTVGEGRVRSWELELKSGVKSGAGNRGLVFKSNGAWLLYGLENNIVFAGRWQDGAKVGGA